MRRRASLAGVEQACGVGWLRPPGQARRGFARPAAAARQRRGNLRLTPGKRAWRRGLRPGLGGEPLSAPAKARPGSGPSLRSAGKASRRRRARLALPGR
ncbi:hypothetical protein NL676_027161 [Syzygium grande]|nr:hypothetical protein NL676_027161 [Syzygium grande]